MTVITHLFHLSQSSWSVQRFIFVVVNECFLNDFDGQRLCFMLRPRATPFCFKRAVDVARRWMTQRVDWKSWMGEWFIAETWTLPILPWFFFSRKIVKNKSFKKFCWNYSTIFLLHSIHAMSYAASRPLFRLHRQASFDLQLQLFPKFCCGSSHRVDAPILCCCCCCLFIFFLFCIPLNPQLHHLLLRSHGDCCSAALLCSYI